MNCPRCGSVVTDTAKFCSQCGKPLKPEPPASTGSTPTAASSAPRDRATPIAPERSVGPQHQEKKHGWVTYIVTILVAVSFGKVVEFTYEPAKELLPKVDNYLADQVKKAGAFHVASIFYGHLGNVYTPQRPVGLQLRPATTSTSSGQTNFWEMIFSSWWYTIKTIFSEGAVTAITGIVALLTGFAITFRSGKAHPFLPLVFAPIVGSCLVYLLLGIMWVAGLVLGSGGSTIVYLASPYPILKECFAAIREERQHHLAKVVVNWFKRKAVVIL